MAQDDGKPARRPYPKSLCWGCSAHRPIEGARSTFVMCTALPVKYPPQPVVTCPAFRPRDEGA